MRILLFGANGQLGRSLAERLPAQLSAELRAPGREQADLSVPESAVAWIDETRPDLVINAAAYTAVDRAESEPQLAHTVNAVAPGLMAQSCARLGIPFLHYSTDYVFDGSARAPYPEDATTGPLNVYGRSKLAGEEAVRAAGGASLILRTSWVYSRHGHNFLRTILRLCGERSELRIVDDQHGAPNSAAALAAATVTLVRRLVEDAPLAERAAGVYHLSCGGETTWCGFARRIVALAGIRGVTVTPITTAQYPTPARRPAWSVLACDRLARTFGIRLPHWEQALRDCLVEAGIAQS